MKVIVCHAAWLPDRRPTLARLLEQLPDATVCASRRREHAAVWAHRAWELAEEWDEDVAILNDDVTVCPEFPRVIEAMLSVTKAPILSLHTNQPEAANARAGNSWVRSYSYTGPGVVLRRGTAAKLLDYTAKLPWAFVSRFNEDNMANHWAWEQQMPMWCSIPAVVLHDVTIPSSLGYDNHPNRVSSVPWKDEPLTDPAYWRRGVDSPPFVESWAKTPWLKAIRAGLAHPRPCEACWQMPALAQIGNVAMCGPCMARGVSSILNVARAT